MSANPEDLHLFDAIHRESIASWMMGLVGWAILTSLAAAFVAGVLLALDEPGLAAWCPLVGAVVIGLRFMNATPPAPPMHLLDDDEEDGDE